MHPIYAVKDGLFDVKGVGEPLPVLHRDIEEVRRTFGDIIKGVAVFSEAIDQLVAEIFIVGEGEDVALLRPFACGEVAACHALGVVESAVFKEGDGEVAKNT